MNDGPSTPPGWVPPPGPSPFDQGYGAPFGPPGYGPGFVPLPPRRPKRFGWGAVIAAFVLGGVVASVALIALVVLVAVNDDGPGASTHQRIGEQAAEVGDCLAPPPGRAEVSDPDEVVACSEAHGSEVAAVIDIPAGVRRPDGYDLRTMADDVCLVAFEGYVGESYDDSPYDYEAVLPSDAAWEAGDRSLWCLVDADGATGSVRRGG